MNCREMGGNREKGWNEYWNGIWNAIVTKLNNEHEAHYRNNVHLSLAFADELQPLLFKETHDTDEWVFAPTRRPTD